MGVNVEFIEWQKTECIRLNITLEQHTKIVDAAKATGAIMNIPFGGAYKRIVAAAKIRPTNPLMPTVHAAGVREAQFNATSPTAAYRGRWAAINLC